MALTVPKQEQQAIEKMQSFTESVVPSFTSDMVQDIAEKAVKGIEFADEIMQPETLELLRVLPEVSKSLERTLREFKQLEESGVFSILFDFAQLVSSAKAAMTSDMVFDLAEKAISAVELADSIVQKGALDLANDALYGFEQAKTESRTKKSITKLQLLKQLNHPETLKALSFFLIFLQKFSREMNH